MPVNSNIALSYQAPKLESPVNMMAQMQQIAGLQQTNQLRALQMEEIQTDRAQQNALAQFMQGYQPGQTDDRQALAFGAPGRQAFQSLTTAARERREAELKTAEHRLKQNAARQEAFGRGLLLARDDPSDTGLNTAASMMTAQGFDVTAQVQQLLAMPVEQRRLAINNIISTDPQGRAAVEFVAPKWDERNAGNRKFVEDMNPRSSTFGRTRGDMPLSATPDAVLSSATSRANNTATNSVTMRGQNMVDARAGANAPGEMLRAQALALANDPEHQQRLAEARAAGTAAGKDTSAARTALPQAIRQGRAMLDHIDGLVGTPEGTPTDKVKKQHPGFTGAVGMTWTPGMRFVPGSNEASFMARLNEVQGGAFLTAFETLKGGGAITEKEGEKATAAITRMSIAQSEVEFRTAAREFQQVLRDAVAGSERRATQAGATPARQGASGSFGPPAAGARPAPAGAPAAPAAPTSGGWSVVR